MESLYQYKKMTEPLTFIFSRTTYGNMLKLVQLFLSMKIFKFDTQKIYFNILPNDYVPVSWCAKFNPICQLFLNSIFTIKMGFSNFLTFCCYLLWIFSEYFMVFWCIYFVLWSINRNHTTINSGQSSLILEKKDFIIFSLFLIKSS